MSENSINTKTAFISIIGEPNVGKSSLLNMILGCKLAIVSHKPQTTRNRIKGILTIENTQLVFLDTPGVHNPRTDLGKYMMDEVKNSLSGIEACIHVVEAGKEVKQTDLKLIDRLRQINTPVLLAINKIDTVREMSIIIKQIEKFYECYKYFAVVPVSAKTGSGRDRIIKEVSNLAVPSEMFFDEDDFTDQSERTIASELVREKLLRILDKEIPHGTAVVTEKMKERSNGTADIDVMIYCEKQSHKGIIIGKNGSMLKSIGTYARKDMEKIFGCKVNLKVWVKVKENWRNLGGTLKSLGYIN